ncbi:MAG: transposase [Oxalobacteraceae bacterium]|nr:MAG: transposase [Oxalobacteraceae bacterium]
MFQYARSRGVSCRHSGKLVCIGDSSQRYVGRLSSTNSAVFLRELISLSQQNPRYGYRRIHALLCRSGRICNPKKVYRLWAQHGLNVPNKRIPPTAKTSRVNSSLTAKHSSS